MRLPLAGQIALWLALNVLFLLLIGALLLRGQFQLGLEALLSGRSGERVQTLAELVRSELRAGNRADWTDTLQGIAASHDDILLALVTPDGELIAGSLSTPLPEPVLENLRMPPDDFTRLGRRERNRPPRTPPQQQRDEGMRQPDRQPGDRRSLLPEEAATAPVPRPSFPKFITRSSNPTRYWIGVRLTVFPPREALRPLPASRAVLVIECPSLRSGGLLFDYVPWLIGISVILSGSALFWTPLVMGITRALRRMTEGAEAIAQGRLETRVPDDRGDEIGRLGGSLNHMAARLQEHFQGQKRFLGDVAHELCSPLARMEMALAVMERRAGQGEAARSGFEDVREEVRHMSGLVNELLSFSKAGLAGAPGDCSPVNLRGVVEAALQREAGAFTGNPVDIRIDVPADLTVLAHPELLQRAVENVLRNALHYARSGGLIEVSASEADKGARMIIADRGPGVPEEAIHRLFDPFYRPETARARETGGTGLGLAIVRSCLESCGGSASAANRAGGGLAITLFLPRPDSNPPPTTHRP